MHRMMTDLAKLKSCGCPNITKQAELDEDKYVYRDKISYHFASVTHQRGKMNAFHSQSKKGRFRGNTNFYFQVRY